MLKQIVRLRGGILAAALTLAFAIFFSGIISQRAKAEDLDPLTEQMITYQGENNWYHYSGNFSERDLIYMLYSPYYNIWQGQEEFNRIYRLSLIQQPSENFDAIRAKVISKNGKISVLGDAELYMDNNTGESVTVGIVLAKGGDLANTRVLLSDAVLSNDGDNLIDIDEQEIEVSSGDTLFFIARATGKKSGGVIFHVSVRYDVCNSSSVPEPLTRVKNIETGKGDFSFTYEKDINALRDKVGIFQNTMLVENKDENLKYVYQQLHVSKINAMDFAGYDTPGYWFTMPNSLNSVGNVWTNKFYSNPNSGYGWSGLCYTAPQDGSISVLGVTARSSVTEQGDDAALFGEPEEWAQWDLILISGDTFVTVAADTIEPDTIKSIETVSGTQNIRVKTGEQVYLRYRCSAPWKVSCITAAFNFVADPIDTFEGWQISTDADDSQFSLRQGEHNIYYAYGDPSDKYYLFDQTDEDYRGGNVFASLYVKKDEMNVAAASASMRIFKAVGDGLATIQGNFTQNSFENTVTVNVYKRIYDNGDWGESVLLFGDETNSKKKFTEFRLNEALNNGDLIFVSVSIPGDKTSGVTVTGDLNLNVEYNVSVQGEEVNGLGDVTIEMKTDQFSDEQGKTGWFYAYGDPDNYVLMKYGFGKVGYNAWSGPEWNNRIEKAKMFPSPYTGSLLIYVADRTGVFRADGIVGLLSTDGLCGVNVSMYHNDRSVRDDAFAFNDFTERKFALEIQVNKGDVILFYVKNTDGDTVAYFTEVLLNFEYALEGDETDVIEKSDLEKYISPKPDYASYLGIENNYTPITENNISAASRSSDSGNSSGKKGCGGNVGTSAFFLLFLPVFAIKKRRAK